MVRETRYLIVRNLPENCTEEIVVDHFQRYGKIQSVKLQNGKDNDSADVSTATVAFNDIKSAAKAHHAKNSIGEVTLRTDYWEGGTPVLASNPGTTVGSATVRSTSYTSSSATPAASRLASSFTWGKGTSEDDVLTTHEKGEASGSCPTPTASAALDKLSSTAFDLQRGRGRERIKQKKFGQKFEKCGSFGRHGTITSARSLEASRSQSEAAVAAANSVVVSSSPSSSLTPATACHTSGSSSSSGSTSLLNPVIITDTKDNAPKDLKESTREVSSRSRPHSIASPSSRHSGLKKSHSHSRSVSRSRSRSRGSSSSRSQSSGTSQSTTPHRSHTSSATRPQSMVGTSRLVNSESRDFKKEDGDVDRRPLGICVSGLPARSSDTSIRDGLYHEYKKHGKVTSVQICGEEGNRCAIVSFKKPEDASKALEASQSKVFFGKSIRVTSHEGVEVEDADKGNDSDGMDEYHSKSTRTLFVGNLEKDTTAADLTEKFKKFGHIIDIDIKRQGATTAFAFVQYSDIASVVAALRAMEGEHIGINKIKLGFGKSMPTCCVWVDCLTEDISSRKLKSAMSRFGEVSYCCVDRKRLKALVHFTSYEDAQYCVSDIKQRPNFLKTKVQVDFASRECQNDFLDQMEKTGQIRANDRPDETGRTHKFRQQRSFDTFPDEGSPTLFTFTRTPTAFASRNNGRSSSGSSSYRRGRQFGETTFPEENHSSSRRTRWPEEFSQSGQFFGSKGSSDDYEAVLREYGHSQRERRERDLSPRPIEDRRVDGQSRQSSRDHSIDRYENNRNVDVYNSRDSSPGSEHNSYHSEHRHKASRDDKYSTRDRYDDSKVEEKDSDRHSRLSRTASPFLRNQSRSHSHDSDYDHRGGSRSQSPPTPIQEDSSAHRIYYADDHKRSLNADGEYSVYSKSKDSDDKGKAISLHSSKLGAEVLKTAGKLKRREHEELVLSDLSKLEKLVRKSDKSNFVQEKSQAFSDKDKKLHFDPSRLGLKGHEQIGSPSSSGSHGDSENGSVSEGDLHHLHEEKHHILQKLQELSEEGVGISEPDSPQTAAKVKSVAVKEALRVSGRIHDDRKGEDLLPKDKKQGAKVREARRDSRNHELGWEDRSVLQDKNMSFSGAISDSDSDSALKRTKTRTESGVDTASKSQSLLRPGVSDEEEADGKSDRSFKLHGSSVMKRLSCDSRLGSKSCSNVTKAAEVSCDSNDLFQGGFSDKDLTVIKPTQNLSKSDSYFPSRDWAAEYGGGEHSPVGCFSPANSDEQSQDSVTSGSLTEKSLKHLPSPSWQHSPLNSLLGQGHSETDYNYYKDFTLPGNISADSLSDDSLGDDVQPPSGEPSLEERIRAIDEMLNMTITNKSSDPSLLMSVLSNKDIANNNDNSVLYSKFRIRKREGAEIGNGGIVADRKPEPSVIMQQVLSKKSILDQDIQRLEQMSEKYDLTGCGPSLVKSDLSTLLRLPDLKVDSCVKPVLSPSLLSSFSSPPPLISSVPATTSSSSSVLLSVATAAVAGSAISSAVFSASVLTTSSVSTPVTTCSIHVSSKPSPIDSSSRFLKVKTLEGVEDLLNVHTISSDSLTLKPDSVMSPLPTSSVCVLTCSGNLFSSSSSSSSSSPVLNSVIGSPLITDSSSFSSVVPHNFKFVTSTLPPLSSALSPVSSITSNFLSNLLHHKPNLQPSVSKLPYTSSSSLSLPSSSSLSVSPSTSGISAAAPFTQGPDKSQLTPIVGQEAPHLCSPSFTPENSRTSLNSHLPGSRSPRIHSQKSERDDGIHTSSKVDLNILVSNEAYSKPDIVRNAGSSISPDIESPVSVQSETSSTSSVPLSSLDIKSQVRTDEKSDVIVCTSLSQPGVLAPHSDDTNMLSGSSVQESGLQHSQHDFGTCLVDRASNKDKLKSWRAVEATCLNVNSSQPVTVQTVEATSLKAVSSQPVMSTCVDHVSSDAGLANTTSSDIRLKSASIGSTSVLQSSSSSVLQFSSSDSGSSGLKLGATSSGSQSTESDAAVILVPRSSNQISASSKTPGDRNDKKGSGKLSAGNSRISNSLSKPEALFAPDLKMEQAASKTDVRHQSQKSTSNKSSSDKKSSKSAHKETHDGKSASGREVGKSEKTSEQDSKSLVVQDAASKSKEVNKVKDKRDQGKESEKLKQKEKEENKKKDEKKGGDKKIEKRPQVGGKEEKQAERKPEDRKDKTNEKSKDSGKVNQTKHSKHESKPDSSMQSKDKSKDVGSKVKDKDKSGSKISEVKHGKTPSKSDSKVKSSKNESSVKSDKENTQKSGVKTIDIKDEVNRSVKVPEAAGKLENKESLTAKSDSKESLTAKSDSKESLTAKSDSKESVLTSKSDSKESLTTPLKKAPEVKAKKEPQKEHCKQTPAKQSDKNQKVKQKEKHRTKESKHQNENDEIITQKLKDEKESKDQEEKERKEKDDKLKEERLKEREEVERKQREKEEKERQKEKEREEKERQTQREEKERQKEREKEEKERLKREREERERQKREEREQREKEREEKERQKEKEREEKLKQKKEEKEERERQKEKEREEKEKQKEKEREEKERQKEKEKEEKERQREKERLEKEKQKEKEREEKEKQKEKEKEEKPKEDLVEKLSEKDNEKKKEKEDKLKIKGSKEKEKTEKIKKKEDHEKKAKKEQVQKEKEEKAKEEKAKKERDEKMRKDKEKAEKKEQEQKKVPPKKPKRNELAALLEHNDMIQMSFTSMYDRVKTQRNRDPEPQHKTEPAPKSSFDKFRQNRKKGGSRSHELYSFDTSSDGSGDLSSLSEDSEPEQKSEKSELSPVKETKPKTKKPIKRPHLSSSSSGEEDEVALLRATKPKGKKQEKSFSEIFSSDSDDDNFQPPVSTVKSAKQKSKPPSKKRKTRDDSSDSMTSRDESVRANLSLATDSLGDFDSSDDEVIKKKKKKTIKSNDADDKASSTETLVKKKITSDVSIESTTPKTGKANKEEKTPKKSKPESKKSPKAIEKKLSVSKDEVKSSNEKKKNKVETGKNDNKTNSAVKLETTQQKVDDEPKLKSKFEPEAIKTKACLKDKEPEKLKAKNKTKLTSEGKSKAEEKPKNKLESASKAGLSKLTPGSGSRANLSKPVASSDKKTDIEKVKLVEDKPPKVKSDEKQKSKEVEVKLHSEKVKAERDKKLEGKAIEEEIKQTEKKIAIGTTKSGGDTSVKMEVDSNSTSAKSCQEVMSVELDTKKSKVKSAAAAELEKSSKVDGEMEVEEMNSKSADGLEKKMKVSGERKKKIEEKDDGLVKKKKKKKFDLSIEEELVNSLITKVYDRDKKKKKMNVLDSESDDTAQSEHSQEPSRLDQYEPSKEEEDMELVVTTEEKPIVSQNMSDKQATEFKPVEQSMEPVTDESAEAPKKKLKKKKEKREPEKEKEKREPEKEKDKREPEKEASEKEVKEEEEVLEVKLEQQSMDLADVTKPPKKKKKKKDHDNLMDREKEKAGKPVKTLEKKSEAQKSEEKKSGNASEEKSGSQVVDEFTSFWGHPKPILIPKRLKDSKKTDDDKSNSKEPRDESKMKESTEKTDLLTEVKEEPGEGRDKQSPSGEDILCELYSDLDKKPPTPRLESEPDASSEYVVPISEAETTVITELGSISALDSVSSSKYSPEPEESSLAVPDEITLGSSIEIDDDDLPSLVIDEISENTDKVKGVKEHKALKTPLDRHAVDLKKGGFSFKDTKSVTSDEEDQASLLIDSPAGDQEVLLSDIINQELKYNSKISNEGEQKSVLGSDRSRPFSDINSKEKFPGLISPQKGLSVKDKNTKISAVDSDKRKDALRAFVDIDRKKDTLKAFGDLDKRKGTLKAFGELDKKDTLKTLGELDQKDTLKTLGELDKKDTLKTLGELDKTDTLKAFGPLDEETKKRDEELLKTLAVLCDPHLEQPVVIDVTKNISQGDKQKLEAERKEAERKEAEKKKIDEEREKIEEEKRKAEEKKLKAEEEKKKEEEKKRKEEEEKERAEKEKKRLEEDKKRKEEERKKAEENKIRAEEEKKKAEEEKKKAEEEKKRMEEEAKKKAEEDEKNRREKEEQLLREASDEAARAVESLLEFQCGYEPESVDMEDELPPLFIESVRKDSPFEPATVPSPQEPATVSSPQEPATVSSPLEPVIVPLPQETDKPEIVSILTSPIPEKVTANLDDQLLSKSLEEIGTYESGETKPDPFLFPAPTSTQVSTPAALTSPRRNSAAGVIREPTPEKMISPQRIVVSSQPMPSHRMQRTISSSPQHSQGQSPQRSLSTQVGLGSPPPVSLHAPPTSVSLHAAPAIVPLHAPPATVPLHAPPATVPLHAPPMTGPLHAPAMAVPLHTAPSTVPLHALPTSISHHTASPAISLHSPAPPVPLHAQIPPVSVIQTPPAAIPAPLQSTPLPPRPPFFASKETKMDRNYLLGSSEVPPHSEMDISLGPQHRRLPAGLIVQPISEPPVRPMAVSPRRKSQEFVSEQHILASRRNTIAAPEEASMTYLDRAFPTYVGPDMILSKEHTQGTSSLPPPVSISLDKMPHDSDSQSSLSLPSHQDNLLLSPKKMSPGFQFKERLPEPPMFHSVTNKSLMQESSLSHFAKGASPDNVFSAYAAKGSSHEQLFYGSKGHPGASAPPDFFKSNKFPDQQTMLHVKSAMNEKPMPAQPIKLGEPLLLPQKNPVPEFVLPHGKAPAHVLEQFPLQPESKNMLVREPLFSPKSQPDNPLNYPDQNIDFLLNSPPRNSVGFSHFPPNTEVNLPLVQKQPDYNLDPLFMSPPENSTVRPSEREHLPRRADGFPASFYQEPASASKPHQDTVTISLQHPPPSLADDEKKNTRKRKRNSRKTTSEDRAAALAEQQAIEQSVQANVDSIRKALNANQAKAAAEKAGGGGVDKKKSLDAYDFEPDLGPDFGSHPAIPSADLLESEPKTLRSRGDRGRGRAMGTRRGRRGRGAMSSMMDQSDSIHRPEVSLFPPTVSPFSSHSAHGQDHLPPQLHHHYHHPHSQPQQQQQQFPRPMAQPNSISRPLPQFFSNPPSSLPSDSSLSLPASADWQLKQTPLPHSYQHKAPQQIVQPPAPLKMTSCSSDVMSPESNKQDLDLSYGESELIINLDDQPLSSEGKENQHSLSSDGEGNLTPSPSTPKSQRSTRTRKQPDYKAIASGNSQVPVQPRSSRSGGSPRAAGNGAQSPKNLSPRTRSSENVSSSPVVKLEKLEVGRTTRSRRDAAGKGQMKDIINDGSGRLEDGLIKGNLDEGRSLSKENIYEFVDNEQELLLESSLRSSRTRKNRNSGSQELAAQQTMPDYMPGSPISSSNSSSLFGHEQKHGLEPQPPEVRTVEESAKMSNVDAIIEAVSKGNFGTFEESQSCEAVKPGSQTDTDPMPVPPTTRSTRRSTEFKKESDEKVEKFAVAENVRPETREACRKALESKEANRKGSEGKEGSRKGPTVPPLIIKVNEEKHYVIERAKGDGPAESEKPPLAFTVKLSDSGTATIKPAGVANVALTPSSQLPAAPVKPPVATAPAPDAIKVELPPKKDGNSLGLFSGLPQSEQQANSETDHTRSSVPVSQAPVWKPPEVVHDEPVISRPIGALHPKVAAKVHASQEIQNSLSQNQQTSASVSQSSASALQTPTSTVVACHQPFISNSTQLSAPKSSPVTPATPQGLKHGWAAGMQQQEPQLQLPTSEPPNSSPYLPPYLQQQMSQLSSPMPREAPLLHKPPTSGTLPEVKLPPNAHSQPILRPDLPGNAHSQQVLRADLPGKVSKPGGLEINSDMAAKLASEVQKHHQNPFSFPPHVPPAHSGQRTFAMPTDQPGHLPSHFTNAALLKAGSDNRPAKSPSIQSQVGAKMVPDGRTQTPPVTSSAMLYAGVVSGQPHSLSPTTASPEGQVIERIQNPLRSEAGQSQSPLGLHVSGSHLQDPGCRFIKDDGQDSSLPVHNERTSSQQMVMLQMLEHQRLQQHLIMAEAAARNSAPDSARLNAMRTVQELARNTPVALESSRKGPMTPSQSLGLSQPLNLTPQSDSRVGQPDPSRVTPKSTPPAPQSPFSLPYFDRSKADSGRLSSSVAGPFMQPSPGGHRDGLPPHVYSELSIANLTAHNTYMVSRLPIDPRIYGSGQQPPHLMRDGVLSGSFPQSFPPGSRFPGLEHPDGKKEQSHSDQPGHHMLRSPSPIQRLQADALRQQLTRMPCDLTARESPVGFLQRYPVMWQGALALKNDNSYVQMHFIAGNRRLPNQALPQPMQNGALPPLRISQRMRLEHAQLEGVAKRMQCEEHYCILIAVACGRDQIDINHQTRALNDGFITYLLSKQAAGIVNVPLPGSEQVRFVVHIFPPCEFVDNSVAQQGSVVLMEQLREVPHAVVIIATT